MPNYTPAQIIYYAWTGTPKPLVYHTGDAKGNRIDKEVDFLGPEEHPHFDAAASGVCNICGQPLNGGVPVKKVLGNSYMDWPLHKEPEATHICEACAFCLMMRPEGRIALFRYPLVAEADGLHLCNRAELREWLIHPPEPPFVMLMPTSQKKHLFAKARVSWSRESFFCNLEEQVVPVDATIEDTILTIEALRGLGINKSMIQSGTVPTPFFRAHGMDGAEWAIATMIDLHSREAFRLALEVAQKMDEEEAKCFMDSKRQTK